MVQIRRPVLRLTPLRLAQTVAVVLFGAYLDLRLIRLSQSEMDQFRERTRLYGDWRARNARKPVEDNETLKE